MSYFDLFSFTTEVLLVVSQLVEEVEEDLALEEVVDSEVVEEEVKKKNSKLFRALEMALSFS